MIMHKQQSKVFESKNPLQCSLAQKLAIAAGVAISLGLMSAVPSPVSRFEFQQQVGDHLLSGVFEGTDRNGDGVVELSELDAFEANWGGYSWKKEDLEVFSWGEKAIGENRGKIYGMNGLNLFARGRQQLKSQALQVWNRQVNTAEGLSQSLGIYGFEYAANLPDNTLFSQEVPLEISPVQTPVEFSAPMMLLLAGITALLVLNPCWSEWKTPDGQPCSSPGKF